MACFLAPMATAILTTAVKKKVSKEYHFHWLISMLWGGVIMLVVEHIAHGEIVLYPPFLTRGIGEALPEILKIGVPMTLAVVFLWLIMAGVANWLEKTKKVKWAEV
ncbi:MAG: hypothetical protein NC818_04025 [Candidatus Omnitrophica bacterium]|nr:hypothetical protein [Candidatus Omnitrophota bacterium]